MSASTSRREAAAYALVAVGALLSAAFALGGVTPGPAFVAHEVNPGADADLVARASDDVFDFDANVGASRPDVRDVIGTAAETGRYNGTDHPQVLHFMIHDSDYRYVRFEGAFYRWNATAGSQASDVDIRMTPTDAGSVARNVAAPYDDVDPAARRAIDSGDPVRSVTLGTVLVERSDTYYAVLPREGSSGVMGVLLGPVALVLQAVGAAYLAVGLGLVALRRRGRRLSGPVALLLAGAAAPVAILVSAVASGDAGLVQSVVDPAVAVVVAIGLFAGVAVARRSYRLLLAVIGGTLVLVVGGGWHLLGSGALADSIVALLSAWLAALPLAAIGFSDALAAR